MRLNLSVVIPAYNEAKNFRAGLLNSAVDYLAKQKYSWEVIFVNDGSTDDTKKLLAAFCRSHHGYRLLDIPHGGKAAAVTSGVLDAAGEIILFTDFDQSTPLPQVEEFLKAHKNGFAVAIGNRGAGTTLKGDTLFRKFRSLVFVTIVQIVLLPEISDTQCGFKSFTRTSAQKIFSSLKVTNSGKIAGGYMGAFDVEALFLARKFGYKIAQIPVEWIKVPSEKLNPWKEPLMMVRDVFKVRLYDLFGQYAKK